MALNFPNSPVEGQTFSAPGRIYVYSNGAWVANVTPTVQISDTAPPYPYHGLLWWRSNQGRLFVYFEDGDSGQWVETTSAGTTPNGNLDAIARVNIAKAGAVSGARRTINFIEGTGATLTLSDDPTNERVNVTVAVGSHTHGAADITSGTIATARLGSGTADSTTFLRGDQTWVSVPTTEADTLASVTGRGATTSTAISLTNSTASTSTSTGALVITGGAAVGGNLYVGGAINGNGSGLTSLNASNLSSGTVPVDRLGLSGTPSSTTYLRGDNTWATVSGGGGGASIWTCASAPVDPNTYPIWWQPDIGKLFIYYNDGTSSQWVESTSPTVATGVQVWAGATAPTDLSTYRLWYNTNYGRMFYYLDSGSSVQWVDSSPAVGTVTSAFGKADTSPPAVANWTWVNQGSATATDRIYGANTGISIRQPGHALPNAYSLFVQPVPSAPYRATARLRISMPPKNFLQGGGICWYESGTGEFEAIYWEFNTAFTLRVSSFNTVTSGASTNRFNGLEYDKDLWMSLYDDNTNRYFQVSPDGYEWVTLYSHARTTFLTPSHVGLCIDAVNSGAPNLDVSMALMSWEITG